MPENSEQGALIVNPITTSNRAILIAGAGHSGSTLLDILLGQHPDIVSLGEVGSLHKFAFHARQRCSCGARIAECEFWRAVASEVALESQGLRLSPFLYRQTMLESADINWAGDIIEKLAMISGSRRLYVMLTNRFARAHLRAADNALFWYEMIRRASGAGVVVDSSKDSRRLKAVYYSNPEAVRVIYLSRDGRAVAASQLRRQGGTIADAARVWRWKNAKTRWALNGVTSEHWMHVRYEDLCRRPKDVLMRICSLVGRAFHDAMLDVGRDAVHVVGGNPMKYRCTETRIRLDERWKSELTTRQLTEFDRIAGSLNRRLGHD